MGAWWSALRNIHNYSRHVYDDYRDSYNQFIARCEDEWELAMAALAIVYVAVGFLAEDASPSSRPLIESIEASLTAIFVLEFTTRFLASRDRLRYSASTSSTSLR